MDNWRITSSLCDNSPHFWLAAMETTVLGSILVITWMDIFDIGQAEGFFPSDITHGAVAGLVA